jgi:hypothetical protein
MPEDATLPKNQSSALAAIWGAIESATTSATHLQIVTMIGDATVIEKEAGEGLNEVTVTPPAAAQTLATNINLALGDVAQCISPALLQPGQEAIVALHKEMVEKGQAIVKENLTLLKDLVKELRTLPG